MTRRPALGRGLASLLPDPPSADPGNSSTGAAATRPGSGAGTSAGGSAGAARAAVVETELPGERVVPIEVSRIDAGKFQPRTEFADQAITDLSQSIREKGVLQPLIVRPVGDRYELIAGERRLRASKLAGLKTVPVLIRESSDGETLELALIENIQRENLNAIELAKAFRLLQEEFGNTQEEISRRVGKDRSTITNHLRLLKLSEPVKQALVDNILTMGHARAILGLDLPMEQEAALKKVVDLELSVRETEELVKRMREAQKPPKPNQEPVNVEIQHITERLRRAFQTRVDISPKKKGRGGEIRIEYYSDEELNRILDLLPDGN